MIRVLEGANCVGKTTACMRLAAAFDLPIFDDPGRHGALEWMHPMSARDAQVQGAQHALTVATLAPHLRLIVDRWVVSNVVYDRLRGRIVPEDFVKRVLTMAGDVKVYVLQAPLQVLEERARRRGRLPLNIAAQLDAFRDVALMYGRLGGEVHLINSNVGEEEVFDEIRNHW